jgi:hypothetical protein
MAVGISKKKPRFLNKTLHEPNTSCLRRGWKKRGRFLLPPSLKSLLDHGLLDSIFGKQTKAYLVAVKWNFESGHYNISVPFRFLVLLRINNLHCLVLNFIKIGLFFLVS